MATTTIRNWDGTQRWDPAAVHHPADEDELRETIRRAAEGGRRLKPVGGALSWSDAIDIPQEAIRFDRMARVLEVDAERRRVRVQAGVRLADLTEALAGQGLALDNFGSITMQTAGGYTGTGSHGTGGRTPILSSTIEAMRLVDGEGAVHALDRDREADLFHAARVHLGCLGAVSELTFRCVEAFDLEETLQLMDFDRALADLDSFVDGHDYCKLWWLPYTRQVQVYTFDRTDKPRTRRTLPERLDESGLSGTAFAGLIGLSAALPFTTRLVHQTVQSIAFRPHQRVDRSDRIIRYAGSVPNHQETEYAIPRTGAARAIDDVRALIERAPYRVNFFVEVRFVAGDDIPMSPVTGRDSCFLGGYIGNRRVAARYFRDFEALVGQYEGRPHWGKTFHRTAAELRALYPQYDSFDAVRRRGDPHGVFRNTFTDRVFGDAGPDGS